ncbi:MAG: VOC family protein [Bacillota bacterium]
MFKRIDHTAFIVKDADASAEFYVKLLGFRKELDINNPAPGMIRIIFLSLADTKLELIQGEAQAVISGNHISLESNDLLADFAILQEKGCKVILSPMKIGNGRHRAAIAGPDDEEIELIG